MKFKDWYKIKKYNAVVTTFKKLKDAPADRYVAFETRNFGWIYSPKNEKGFRKLVAQE